MRIILFVLPDCSHTRARVPLSDFGDDHRHVIVRQPLAPERGRFRDQFPEHRVRATTGLADENAL
jgi:hypothetical protein